MFVPSLRDRLGLLVLDKDAKFGTTGTTTTLTTSAIAPRRPAYRPVGDNDYANLVGTSLETLAGQGVMDTTHTERGLTWNHIALAGHMIPSYQPATTYRITEFLLGRVDSLQSTVPLSHYPDAPQPPKSALGKGTARNLSKGPACTW
ncbi:hypothetical protein P8C59_000435 [Phyllachora maydis]|nr:hypothetical protein P8C59_000435 [Phyllachora maydis]